MKNLASIGAFRSSTQWTFGCVTLIRHVVNRLWIAKIIWILYESLTPFLCTTLYSEEWLLLDLVIGKEGSRKRITMLDSIFLVATILFFLLSLLYVRGCEKLW